MVHVFSAAAPGVGTTMINAMTDKTMKDKQ
jgi:hypothetical protein